MKNENDEGWGNESGHWYDDENMSWDDSFIDSPVENEQSDADMDKIESNKLNRASKAEQLTYLLAKFKHYGLPDSEVEAIICGYGGDEDAVRREILNRLCMYLEQGTLKVIANSNKPPTT